MTEPDEAFLASLFAMGELDDLIPGLARNRDTMRKIEAIVQGQATNHDLIHGDARTASALDPNSVHLVVTSPPYWTLKRYNDHDEQLGHVADYDDFVAGLDEVWKNCHRALVPGGRLIINIGDVCLSRKKNNGRHTVRCRRRRMTSSPAANAVKSASFSGIALAPLPAPAK